jgi:hypothetical protein
MEYFDLQDEHRNIIIPEEYDGKIQLIMGQLGQDGTVYKRWGKLQLKKDEYTKTAIPWKISLGSKDQAITALKFFLQQLGQTVEEIDDGIPF